MSCTHKQCKLGWQITGVVFLLVVLVVVIMGSVFVSQQDEYFRICPDATAAQVVGGPGEAGAVVEGMITLDTNTDNIPFEFRTQSNVTAIVLRGPYVLGTRIGPIILAVCGVSPASPCDTTSVPGQIKGKVLPVAESTEPIMNAIRKQPYLYYIEFLTNAVPATPGAARAPLTTVCGFA